MTRAALRKAQHGLFEAGPAAAMREQPEPRRETEPFLHYCACGRWGSHGVGVFRGVAGTWWCGEHRPHYAAGFDLERVAEDRAAAGWNGAMGRAEE